MKTTLDLPDDLFAEAKATAARRRTTLKAMVEHALRREIAGNRNAETRASDEACFELDQDGMPILKKQGGTPVTNEMIYDWMDELGV